MLISLRISNYVLMDDHRIEFHPGLNVLTGETGAGKSVILSALSLLTGERGSAEKVRDPNKDAILEASFELDSASSQRQSIHNVLDELGIPVDDDALLMKRVVSPEGRSRMFINNTQCLLKQMKELGERLVDIHGQHEHQSLLRKSTYTELVDAYGKENEILQIYKDAYQAWRGTKRKVDHIEQEERERLQREDLLRFQTGEISRAELVSGEETKLESRIKILRNAEQLNQAYQAIINRMSAANGTLEPLLDELDQLDMHIQHIAQMDESKNALAEQWQSAVIALREVCNELEQSASGWEFDPEELERLQQRRFLLRDLTHKYGSTVEDVLAYHQKILEELEQVQQAGVSRDELIQLEAKQAKALITTAQNLHKEREQKAKVISKTVTEELQALGMQGAVFVIRIEYRQAANGLDMGKAGTGAVGESGADDIEFLVTTIPGKEPKPLREVASGGEISRIMLALKCVFGEADPVGTMVFDEIDAGIGGETGEVVANRLAQLAAKKQIICITHLPHIASQADLNLRVGKEQRNGEVVSTVTPLQGKERENEIARMLGAQDSAASLKYARELLKSAGKKERS